MSTVDIVLATFNGSKYLEAQVWSILQQTHRQFRLIIHDDGSIDGTKEKISYLSKLDPRIVVLDGPSQGGARANFNYLLQNTNGAYVFCADQDDVWHTHKIEFMLERIKFYEAVHGPDLPLLVHTDLKLINDSNQILSNSFWHYQNIDPNWGNEFNKLLTQNVVTGCAMVVNRSLLLKALPVPAGAVMHDWWLGLVACAFGKIYHVEEPLIYYRQHENNQIGAKSFNTRYIMRKLVKLYERNDAIISLKMTSTQAESFLNRFPSCEQAKLASLYMKIMRAKFLEKRALIIKNKFYKTGPIRNLAWIFLI